MLLLGSPCGNSKEVEEPSVWVLFKTVAALFEL